MPKTKIRHFLGKTLCGTVEEADALFARTVDGENEFFLVKEHTLYPYLTILVSGGYANATCVPTESAAGRMAFTDLPQPGLDPDGITAFTSQDFDEKIEIDNGHVIPKELAIRVAREFVETGAISDCVQWEEV